MMLKAAGILLLTVTLVESYGFMSTSKYTYMVLAPRTIRPASTLPILVHFSKPVANEILTAKLIETKRLPGPGRKEEEIIRSELTKPVPNGARDTDIGLTIPNDIKWGSFTLNITGTGTVTFHNSTSVYASSKTVAIFVQTDKAIYKPGDTVQYRVFAVDRRLSLVDPILNIEIFGPKGNKLDEKMGVKDKFGYEGSLRLSTMPPQGRWRITVRANETDEREDYNFEVKEYVLPQFEVTVQLDPFGKTSDAFLKGTVTATYTFGDPVNGVVIVTLSKKYGSGFFDVKALRREPLTLVNGKASFQIPLKYLKRVTRNIEYETVKVDAKVTETITGITLEGEGEIRYYSNPFKVSFFPNLPNNFRRDFGSYKVLAKVTQQDDSPPDLKPTKDELAITVTYFTDEINKAIVPDNITIPDYTAVCPFIDGEVFLKKKMSIKIAPDGTVEFEVPIPESTATMTIKAEYFGVEAYKEVRRFRSPSNSFFKSEIMNVNPLKIDDIVSIRVRSTFGPITANWLVLSRGQVVASRTDLVISGKSSKSSEGVVQFKLTRDMSPSARFVAYYVKPDDEVIADGLNFVVQDPFENKVTIAFVQPSPQKPKAFVDLKVTADRDSLVKVLTVDKSVKLLAEGNDITQDRVKDELNQFGDSPWIVRGWGPIRQWTFPADDVYDIFDNAQLRVLSDAFLYRFDLWSLPRAYGKMARGGARMQTAALSANDGAGGAPPEQAQNQIRKEFPQTWMWTSKTTAMDGTATFSQLKVPDTMTTYIASVFALNLKTGLGVGADTAELMVNLPFFVKMQLPYSVIRNEIAVIQANIFNNLQTDHNVLVTLARSDDFVGVTVDSYNKVTEVTTDMTKCVQVKKGQPTPVYFNIKPTKVKTDMKINVKAAISKPIVTSDQIERDLIVKAEGIEKEKNSPIFVSFKTNNAIVETKDLVYPKELVPDSEHTTVTVFGDPFGASFENLDNLIKLPYGCGEQNMVNFAPAVFTAAYLKATGRFNKQADVDRIKDILRTGYQRQMLYQRSDGAFSAFGEADKEGSLWLTAFVAKSFAQAARHQLIVIDHNVVERAVKFIIKQKNTDGTLNNVGTISHKALQGGPAGDRAMLAYVIVALQEVKDSEIIKDQMLSIDLNDAITSLTATLALKVPLMTTDYEKAIGAYALRLRMHPAYNTLLNGLESSLNKEEIGDTKYWKNPSPALEIEIASYVLCTYSKLNDQTNGLKVLKWLIGKRNPNGGFLSTQDTVVAIQAFSEFAALIYTKDVALTIDICKDTCAVPANKKQIIVNNQNKDTLQIAEYKGKVTRMVVDIKGKGTAMIDINQFYNVKSETSNAYDLKITTLDATMNKYTVKVCARYKIQTSESNMAIMDIGAVSGFEVIKDKVSETTLMKRLEVASGRLVIYFDKIPKQEVCVSVPFQRVSFVSGVQPATFLVYSYYDPAERLMKSYIPPKLDGKKTSVCQACGNVCCQTNNLLNSRLC